LAISLMIIACEIENVGIKRIDMCRKYKLGMETLVKHELVLQDALKRTPQ
jgi:hypothetical protein